MRRVALLRSSCHVATAAPSPAAGADKTMTRAEYRLISTLAHLNHRSFTSSSSSSSSLASFALLPSRQSRFNSLAIGEYIYGRKCLQQLYVHAHQMQQPREFSSSQKRRKNDANKTREGGVRFASLLSKHLGLSRRQSERMILTERVTLFGKVITSPDFVLYPSNDPNQDGSKAVKVDGKLIVGVDATLKLMHAELQQQLLVQQHDGSEGSSSSSTAKTVRSATKENSQHEALYSDTRIWLANKLKGELITEDDPVGRPSMLQRLTRGGVGKVNKQSPPIHLKPVGRLDMMTEGLMIFTNNGKYARELELPNNQFWRTYRVRVHGRLTMGKLRAMRKGITVRVNDDDKKMLGGDKKDRPSGDVVVSSGKLMRYGGIKVSIERKNLSSLASGGGSTAGGGTNTWLRITCTEGKNRQLRRILGAVGLDVTRLIRISYADYDLNTIPPGMAIEVNCKQLDGMKNRGPLFASSSSRKKKEATKKVEEAAAVEWINYS